MIPDWVNKTGISDLLERLDDYLGFIYLMELSDGSYYVGRKQFWNKSGANWRQSDWETYTSSSNKINRDLESGVLELVERSIIAAFTSKSAIRYAEASGIIRSGSYLDAVKGHNWSIESCKGIIKLEGTDRQQMQHLEEFFK